MLVSISIFAVVVTMAIGTLLVLIDANGRAQSMQLVMTNLTFALDSMTREIRTGYNWSCGTYSGSGAPAVPNDTAVDDCSGAGGNYLSIIESGESLTGGLGSKRVTYWFDSASSTIKRKLGNASDAAEEWVPLVGSDIIIDDVRIVVTGTQRQGSTGNIVQPTATFYIKGKAGVTAAQTSGVQIRNFDLQTTVTQRLLDI